MEPTVIATIIGAIGTGLRGMFGYFIHSVRGDIRDVRGDVNGSMRSSTSGSGNLR
ncbi:MAG: hypothetical protein OXH78_00315 [Acidimicrobiaceae bacterium]|nr:hypothetical protein [Acidimicrobiaceae bacterium]